MRAATSRHVPFVAVHAGCGQTYPTTGDPMSLPPGIIQINVSDLNKAK